MKINKAAHIPWLLFVLAASAAATVLYLGQFHPERIPPNLRFFGDAPPDHDTIGGTQLGLSLGAISFAIFIFAALLGMRKKLPTWRMGHVQTWLRAHIWLTLLTIPLILLHSGFQLGGPMTTLLMALYAVVMVSGIYGLILQNRMPSLMKEQLPAEIVFEQIPLIRAQLCADAERLLKTYTSEATASDVSARSTPTVLAAAALPNVASHAVEKTPTAEEKPIGGQTHQGTPLHPETIAPAEVPAAEVAGPTGDPVSEALLADFLRKQVLPYLRARRGEKYRLGHPRESVRTFRFLSPRVAAPYRPRVVEMQGWCDERRLLDAQTRMQHWLHGWLLLHVPLSFLLILLTAWHAYVTLFYY